MQIVFYGMLGQILGASIELDVPAPCTIGVIRAAVVAARPEAAEMLLKPSCRACVDETLVTDEFVVLPTQEVEFLPVVSGG
jgi:hypothetical protein